MQEAQGEGTRGRCLYTVCFPAKRKPVNTKGGNSFDGKLTQKPQAEFPITDKPDKENHGMGLRNIKNTVEKYQGTMDFKVRNRVFILSMMMKNEGGKEDGFWSDR